MNVELSHLELWLIYGIAGFVVVVILRAFIYRTSFFGRALICFSAGLAIFSCLVWNSFDELIDTPDYFGSSKYDMHLLNNHEHTIRYYYWYAAITALALGSIINIIWLLLDKWKNHFVLPAQQAKIFSLSIMFGCLVVLFVASFILT